MDEGPVPGLTYLLPIRVAGPPDPELTAYLEQVAGWCPLLVVDGSPPEVFAAAHRRWSPFAAHVVPDPARRCANGKVRGVLTGLDRVGTELVVIADDDVRYDLAGLAAIAAELRRSDRPTDVIVPQNHFVAAPGQRLAWHARWDTARTLVNRSTGGDFPGTLGCRLAAVRAGYDGDVLFENLELLRTVEARGGRWRRCDELYVARRPPTARHFAGQRVRQAYDELARPARFALWLAVLPALATLMVLSRRWRWARGAAGTLTVLPAAVAEAGRRRGQGPSRFPATASLLAPGWAMERAVTVWLALAARARGGVGYGDGRIVRAATSRRQLARRWAAPAAAGGPPLRPVPA